MKLSVMQENLARGLSVVSRAVSSRSTLPVLANVLLRTEDAGLKLTATNLEIGITYWVPGQDRRRRRDHRPGPAPDRPRQLVCRPASGSTWSSRPATRCTIRAGRFETHVKGIDAEEFPAIPTAGERPTTRISQKVLKQALDETAFAAATDEARPILTGVLCRFEGDQLTLAAADNYRIAVKTIPILDPVEETSIVVPARSLNELMPVLADIDDPVDIVLAPAKNQILFHLEGIDLVSRLIDGQFPNYQQVLPKSHTTRAVLDREELLKAVRPGGPHRQRSRRTSSSSRSASTASRASPSPRTRRSATTRARSRRPSRATARRSPSTPGTWPTSSRTSTPSSSRSSSTDRSRRASSSRSATTRTSTSSCRSGRPPEAARARSPATGPARALASSRPARLRRARGRLRARAAAGLGARTPRARRASSRRSSLLALGRARTGPRPTPS